MRWLEAENLVLVDEDYVQEDSWGYRHLLLRTPSATRPADVARAVWRAGAEPWVQPAARCGIGSWVLWDRLLGSRAGQRPSLAAYVVVTGHTGGAAAPPEAGNGGYPRRDEGHGRAELLGPAVPIPRPRPSAAHLRRLRAGGALETGLPRSLNSTTSWTTPDPVGERRRPRSWGGAFAMLPPAHTTLPTRPAHRGSRWWRRQVSASSTCTPSALAPVPHGRRADLYPLR
jgi:hypothetical protein